MLFFAAVVSIQLSNCVPARWPWGDGASLSLLEGSPINCLVVEEPQWNAAFLRAAQARKISMLAAVSDAERARKAAALGFDALVVEGDAGVDLGATGKPVVELPMRAKIRLDADVAGTVQGLWPGVRAQTDGVAHAGPTGAPWIDTNTGFLRYLRASARPGAGVWIANRPPENSVLTAQHYIQAIGDAAMSGARWVVALDSALAKALRAGDPGAKEAWMRINRALAFYERQKELVELPDVSGLAVVQGAQSGALMSGGILDMIAARHIPVTPVPADKLPTTALPRYDMLLNIDPSGLSAEQQAKVVSVARRGGTIMNGPPGWKIALPPPREITFGNDQIKQLDEVWREINMQIGRRNFAVRLFGAPSMLSNLKGTADRKRLALHLVNYSGYPVESITAHVLGKFGSATLLTPQGTRPAEVYEIEDGTGIDIDRVEDVAILVLEAGTPPQPKR